MDSSSKFFTVFLRFFTVFNLFLGAKSDSESEGEPTVPVAMVMQGPDSRSAFEATPVKFDDLPDGQVVVKTPGNI